MDSKIWFNPSLSCGFRERKSKLSSGFADVRSERGLLSVMVSTLLSCTFTVFSDRAVTMPTKASRKKNAMKFTIIMPTMVARTYFKKFFILVKNFHPNVRI